MCYNIGMKLLLLGLLALSCAGQSSPRILPNYTPQEREECLLKPELKADKALLKCAVEHGLKFCPKREAEEIEELQIQETSECLDRL